MRRSRVIVLKFGGSVLSGEEALPGVVHEIYRWRREGWRAVAVVSALAGRTSALLEECGGLAQDPSAGSAVAAHLGTGEHECAARLGLLLERAGVPAAMLGPSTLDLRGVGDALDAAPVGIDTPRLHRALDDAGVAVVPGFLGVDADGRTVAFGRGGSDLTALFLAGAIEAGRCRLVKDVDGLYERDPGGACARPRRFIRATWADALATDGSIIQHKALRYAQRCSIPFELGSLNGVHPTIVGADATEFGPPEPAPGSATPLAVLGAGVVGGGVIELVCGGSPFKLHSVAVRDPDAAADRLGLARRRLTNDPVRAARSGASVVIEAMGGLEPAGDAIEAALRAGSHVVTANKRVVAAHGARLGAIARECGVSLSTSAAVGGSTPVLETARAQRQRRLRRFEAILNGTGNFVLDRVEHGRRVDEAIAEARACGLAEADPARDLDGRDAADKLVLVAAALGFEGLSTEAVARRPIDEDSVAAARADCSEGSVVRQIARLIPGGDGGVSASVQLESVPADSPLGRTRLEQNAAVFEWCDGGAETVRGRGAGRWPTAEAAIADALSVVRGETHQPADRHAEAGDRRSAHV